MGAAVLFPKFLRKLQCIRRSHKKQNRCPMSPLEYIQACTANQMCLKYNTSINSLLTTDLDVFLHMCQKWHIGGSSISQFFLKSKMSHRSFK